MPRKKPAKKAMLTPEYDSRREQNVLLGEMSKSIRAIAEGHGSIVKKLDNVESELAYIRTAVVENGRDIKKLETGHEKLEVGQQELREGHKALETRINNLESGQKTLEAGQQELKQEVKEINQKLDTVTTDHEQRIQKLETVR